MLSQLSQEVQGVEHVHVLFEILRVLRVEQNTPFERFVADLLQQDGRWRDVFGQILLRFLIQDPDAIVNVESQNASRP